MGKEENIRFNKAYRSRLPVLIRHEFRINLAINHGYGKTIYKYSINQNSVPR